MNSVETLLPDEKRVVDLYRRAKIIRYATLEIIVHDARVEHINFTEKYRPESERKLREVVPDQRPERLAGNGF